jgi:hypothetical protein
VSAATKGSGNHRAGHRWVALLVLLSATAGSVECSAALAAELAASNQTVAADVQTDRSRPRRVRKIKPVKRKSQPPLEKLSPSPLLPTAAISEAPPASETSAAGSPAVVTSPPATVVATCQPMSDYARISIPWAATNHYLLGREGHTVVLTLPGSSHLDVGSMLAAGERCGRSVTVTPGEVGVSLRFELPPNTAARDAQLGDVLVIDLFRRPALAAASGAEKPSEPHWPPPVTTPAAAPEGAAVASAPAQPLRFSWSTPTAAAAFRRGDTVWLVFDHPLNADTAAQLSQLRTPHVESIDQRPHPRATVLRLKVADTARPRLERNGNAWIVRLDDHDTAPYAPSLAAHPDALKDKTMRLLVPLAEPAEPLAFTDPDVGDSLVVVPVRSLDAGVARGYDYAQLRILPSEQGVVVQPLIDDLRVRTFPEGIEVTRAGGLQLSPVSEAARAAASISTGPVGTRIIPRESWPTGHPADFERALTDLNLALSRAADADRPSALLGLARLYVGHGLGAEAVGAFERLQAADPAAIDQPETHLLRGVAQWLSGHQTRAAADLRFPGIGDTDEGRLWQTLVGAGKPDPSALPTWSTMIAGYPPALRRAAGLALLDAVAADATPAATELLSGLRALIPDAQAQAQLDYQEGRIKAASGDVDGAVAAWTKVIDGEGSADAAAHARFDRVQLLRREGKMPIEDAIDALDQLRVTWRGDELQYRTMVELGHLQSEAGHALAALRTWRGAISEFPTNPDNPAVAKTMGETLERASENASAQPPWKTVALFEEFKELIPSDDRGTAILSRYAEQLVAADLRPQAASVLEKLMASGLPAADRATTALRLAEIRLTDGKAEAALASAAEADRPELPAALQEGRRRVVARALLALNRTDEALAVIAEDHDADADAVRLAAFRQKGDWEATAATIERMAGGPKSPTTSTPQQAGAQMLDRAAALTLANDEERLAQLRNGPHRPAPDTPAGQAIELMTKPPAAIRPEKDSIAAAVADAEKLAAAAKRAAAPGASAETAHAPKGPGEAHADPAGK